MKLTDKAFKDFEMWLENQEVASYKVIFPDIPVIVQNSYIIDWFDSVGLFINTKSKFGQRRQKQIFWYSMGTVNNPTEIFENRQYCLNSAIVHANNIYNKRK